jgi:hypothetical protein
VPISSWTASSPLFHSSSILLIFLFKLRAWRDFDLHHFVSSMLPYPAVLTIPFWRYIISFMIWWIQTEDITYEHAGSFRANEFQVPLEEESHANAGLMPDDPRIFVVTVTKIAMLLSSITQGKSSLWPHRETALSLAARASGVSYTSGWRYYFYRNIRSDSFNLSFNDSR